MPKAGKSNPGAKAEGIGRVGVSTGCAEPQNLVASLKDGRGIDWIFLRGHGQMWSELPKIDEMGTRQRCDREDREAGER